MTPDTAALRALADRADDDSSAPVVTLDTATLRALCDAADEVERLRDPSQVEVVSDALRRHATERVILPAGVAVWRCVTCRVVTEADHTARAIVDALLDRHAPQEGS